MSEEKVNKYIEFLTSKEAYKNYYAGNPKLEEVVNGLIEEIEQKDNKINKVIDKMKADKMEQFDDYVIYLIESYLEILEE